MSDLSDNNESIKNDLLDNKIKLDNNFKYISNQTELKMIDSNLEENLNKNSDYDLKNLPKDNSNDKNVNKADDVKSLQKINNDLNKIFDSNLLDNLCLDKTDLKKLESNLEDNKIITSSNADNRDASLNNNDFENNQSKEDVLKDNHILNQSLNQKQFKNDQSNIKLVNQSNQLLDNLLDIKKNQLNSQKHQLNDRDSEFTQLDQESIQLSNQASDQLKKQSNDKCFNQETLKKETDQPSAHQSGKNNQNDSNELVEKLKTELSRLKKHLIQIEEDYTNELIEVQQREQNLEQQLIEANAEIEKLNRQLNNTGPLVAIRAQAEQALDERDHVLQRCSKLEDEVQQRQAALANLQLVIERMQKEHDQRIQTINKLHEQNLMEERCRYSQLENEINKYQLKLKESNTALQAAARLSQQLHAKQETIDQLKIHLQNKEDTVNRLHDEINNLNASCEGKVDKQFIKNLIVGYFNASSDKKQDVARLLARILDFNEQEMKKSGIQLNSTSNSYDHLGHRRQNSSSSTASSNNAQDESFAQQFVHFLEEESKVHRAPVARQLAHDLTKVILPSEIRPANLISKQLITSSLIATKNELNSTNIDAETESINQMGQSHQQNIKPMLIPNSAIMNAQLSKLSFNNFESKSQTTILQQDTDISNSTLPPSLIPVHANPISINSTSINPVSVNQTTTVSPLVLNQAPLNQSSNSNSNEKIKPIVLNFSNNLKNDN